MANEPSLPPRLSRSDILKHRLGVLSRFGVVGAVAASIDIGVSNALFFGTPLGPVTAKAIAIILATTVSFVGNRQWTFRARQYSRNVKQQYGRFWIANAAGFAVNVGVVAIAAHYVDLDDVLIYNVVANVAGLGLATVLRFALYSSWVFAKGGQP